MGTFLVGLVVLGIVVGALLSLRKDKKNGKCPGCASSCKNCHSTVSITKKLEEMTKDNAK